MRKARVLPPIGVMVVLVGYLAASMLIPRYGHPSNDGPTSIVTTVIPKGTGDP